jgi:hypothetical protein
MAFYFIPTVRTALHILLKNSNKTMLHYIAESFLSPNRRWEEGILNMSDQGCG